MRTNLWLVVLAAVAFPAVAAADPGVFCLLPSNSSFELSVPFEAPDAPAVGAVLTRTEPAFSIEPVSRVRYRPSPYRPRVSRPPVSVMPLTAQTHVGFLDPIDNFSAGFNGGLRFGPQVESHIQVGLGLDWWHRSDDEVLDLGPVDAPIGTAERELVLSESSANLVPIMMFAQVSFDENMPVIPYVGLGIGYEWLFLTANNYLTDESFDQTFGGFGWQAWVGAGLPLDLGMRLNGELFFNACEVGSEVDVNIKDYGPATVRNVIQMNSFGARVGISWGF